MFRFKVSYFCEDEPESGVHTEEGIVRADSYGEAADRIVEYYGEKEFISFNSLYRLEDVLVKDEIDDMWKE